MWTTPENFRAKLGGTYYIDTPNMIVAHGENLFRLKRREEDGLLAVDFDIYDVDGSKIATVRNGNVMQHDADRFHAHKEHHRYWITEKGTDRIICDIRKVSKAEDGSELEISVDLFTKKGFHLIAGPEETNLGGMVFRGGTIRGCGAGIVIE
jgi:hypothetical protein